MLANTLDDKYAEIRKILTLGLKVDMDSLADEIVHKIGEIKTGKDLKTEIGYPVCSSDELRAVGDFYVDKDVMEVVTLSSFWRLANGLAKRFGLDPHTSKEVDDKMSDIVADLRYPYLIPLAEMCMQKCIIAYGYATNVNQTTLQDIKERINAMREAGDNTSH